MPRGGALAAGWESKTLAWGFAMAPHRLCALVEFVLINLHQFRCSHPRSKKFTLIMVEYMYNEVYSQQF